MNSEDPYLKVIEEQWHYIVAAYEIFKDKKPIIEYDITHKRIYSYPAKDYIRALSRRTRSHTRKMYEEATRENQFLLFVKDFENQRLRSYVFDLPSRS
jgi:hypothetical protein